MMDNKNEETCQEVVGQYDVSFQRAMTLIHERWKNTPGRFYGYMVAHEICASLLNNPSYEEPQRMKLKLEISVDNDAFLYGDGEEMSRILATVARMFNNRSELRHDRTMIRDSNGNRIGWFEVK